MRKSLLIFAAASLLLAGCQKEQPVEKELSNVVVTEVSATFEDLIPDGATKASVNITGNVGKFSWQGEDEAAFILDSKSQYGQGTYNENTKKFNIVGSANNHYDAVYPFDLVGSTSPSTDKVTSITVPASRTWAIDQTNVSMYGSYSGSSYTFKHLGGLVKVTVVNVPVEAKTFVFKTAGKKINGTFDVVDSGSDKVINTSSSPATGEDTYTLNLNVATANTTMEFYVPLPVGEKYVFSFYLKDSAGKDLAKVEGSTEYDVARKSILVMPTITLTAVDAGIEDTEKAAVVQEVPAGHSGDFLLANSEKVLLKINAGTEYENKNINLKYNGGNVPTELEIQVVGENVFNKKLSGNLPSTHVEFTQGHIDATALTTSSSTFAVINPATVGTLTVNGGNVKIEGATVTSIVVAQNAVASEETKAPVQIVVEKSEGESPVAPNVGTITANADVVVAPESGVTVKVDAAENVKVAKDGEGTVKDKNDQPITTKAAAQIGDIKYFTLADAIAAVNSGDTIKLVVDVEKAAGISVPEGKNFTVDFGGHKYAMECPGAGSAATQTAGFQLLKNSNIVFKNGKIECTVANKDKTWVKTSTSKGIALMIQNYANLTLEDMTIDATNIAQKGTASTEQVRYAVSTNNGSTTFAGKTKIITVGDDIAFDSCDYDDSLYPGKPTVTWSCSEEGSVTGGIELSGGKFVVETNLSVSAPVLAAEGESTLEIGEGATLSPATNFSDPNPNISNHATGTAPVQVKRGASLTICGDGVVDSKTVASAVIVTVKGDDSSKTAKLTVDGKVTLQGKYYGISGNGDRQNTEITVKGGNIKGTEANDCAGIYHPQSGSLNISGGTIEGAVGIYVKAGTVSTSVEGGEIKGTGIKKDYSPQEGGFVATGDAIVFDNCDYPGGAPNATINGGTFTSKNGLAVASYAKEGVEGGPIKPVINGGTFSDLSGVNYVADNGTYKLANNVTLANPLEINSGKTFTIDLGGKTLTGRTNIKHGNVTFKTGTISTTGDVQALNVYGSASSAENYSVVTVASDVTVNAGVYAVCVFGETAGSTGYGAVANIAGTINTTGDSKNGAIFVSGNLGVNADSQFAVSQKNKVNIESTAKITSSTDAAVALNGSATVTIAEGAKLTGATAIAAKRGKLIVNGGTITGTMDPGNGKPDAYFNGAEMTGSAVSATATYKNDGPLSVELKGGTYTSKAYTILNNHDGCTFQISGGKYETTKVGDGIAVYARLGSVNITGGEFINASNSEATLHVGCPAAVEKSLQPTLTISGSSTVVKNNATEAYPHKSGWKALTVNMANEINNYKAVTISGGEFHGQKPDCDDSWTEQDTNGYKKFLAEGYEAKETSTGVWTVFRKE